MSIQVLRQYTFGDTVVEYLYDSPTGEKALKNTGAEKPAGAIGLRIYPAALAAKLANRREIVGEAIGEIPPALGWNVESLVQFKLLGDNINGYHQGLSMRNSETLSDLRFDSQHIEATGDATSVVTRLVSARGYACEHYLTWQTGAPGFSMRTVFFNLSDAPLTLEMLSSFSLGGITPFAVDDAPGRMFIHRFRSNWSAEGRHERQSVEALHLERSWMGFAARNERFGQIGSMPARVFFPCAALEDQEAGVLWGAQLYTSGSWQMEFYRMDDCLSLSGGLADREFGHWMKTVAPGESFASPDAIVATAQGDIDALCARLIELQEARLKPAPASEEELPVACNEWCTSWGDPRHANIIAMADRLKGTGVKYLTIDCGWYKKDGGNWMLAQGDWEPNPNLFPQGIEATAQAIRERGMIPGLWFEMEVIGAQSPRFNDTAHMLKRDGFPITASGRRFLDFRDPWVEPFLTEKVIERLRDSGFGYIKVDYNETIGIGADGAESLGEGLRQHMEGVLRFFDKMRADLPELVIEDCASGGQRLAPAFLSRASQGSFSDAFECLHIPIIGASLQRLVPPRQLQVWAVLRPGDTPQRFHYLLAGGLLGRLCLSGDIADLSDAQVEMVKEVVRFYQKAAPIIRDGSSRYIQQIGESWEHPTGAQAVLRVAKDGSQALVVAHSFGAPLPAALKVELPEGEWQVTECYPTATPAARIEDGALVVTAAEFEGKAYLLKKK